MYLYLSLMFYFEVMVLGRSVITSLDQMKETFHTKYEDYCWSRDLKEEIFKIILKEEETLEEYVERFQYNLKISPYTNLPIEVLIFFLVKGMKMNG